MGDWGKKWTRRKEKEREAMEEIKRLEAEKAAAMDAEDSCSPMTSRANLGRLLCVVIPTSPSLKIEKTA